MDVVQLWKDASNDKLASAVISIFMLVCLILVAVYVVSWFRNLAVGEELESNPLAEIERLRAEGKISPFEYQRLKQVAAKNMRSEKVLSQKSGSGVLTLKEAQLKKALAGDSKSDESPQANPDFSDSERAEN
jgi:hypothetical protein